MSDLKHVTIYTRGIATPGGGAYGALLACDGHQKQLSGGEVGASNNRMDLLAAIEALRALKRPCRVTLYNCNGYLIEGMSKGWAARWRSAKWVTAGGNPVAHAELWDALLELSTVHTVDFVWLPAEGIPEYAQCQRVAREVIQRQVRRIAESRAVAVAGNQANAASAGGENDGEGELVDVPIRPCVGCGRPISPERLEALPDATRCVVCQRQAEATPTDWRVSQVECPRCAARGLRSRLVWRMARDPSIPGYFLGCSLYPECKYVDRE